MIVETKLPTNSARRKQIMDAAREIAAKQGWPAVTVRAIGKRIGCSAPSIYQYFRNKDRVLAALADEGLLTLGEALDQTASSTDGSAKRVRATIRGLWDFAMDNRELYVVIYGGDGLSARVLELAPETLRRSVAKLIAKRGGKDSAEDVGDRLAATVHGFIGLTLSGAFPGGRARAQALCDRMVDDLIRGLGRE